MTIVDKTEGIRNWVWQIALDKDEHPVIAYPHIDDAKTSHYYWYARWTGSEWKNTKVINAGHAFHQNWNQTERCYSGGMSLDPDNINDMYLSIPTKDGQYNKDGVYEIWKYTIDDEGNVAGSEQITQDSPKNNARPFILPGSKNSKLRLGWIQGDYYYWMVNKNYPKGYPTRMMCDYEWEEELTKEGEEADYPRPDCICLGINKTLNLAFAMNESKYEGKLFTLGNMTYSLGTDYYPVITIGENTYRSQNRLLTSDDWATKSSGTSGDNHPTKLSTWVLSMTYDGNVLTTYRNGLVDQVIETTELQGGTAETFGDEYNHTLLFERDYYACASPVTVQNFVATIQAELQAEAAKNALLLISMPERTYTDIVLPTTSLGLSVVWSSSDASIISPTGVLTRQAMDTTVVLTATIGHESKTFKVSVPEYYIGNNTRYQQSGTLDLTSNTATGFQTNKYGTVPEGLLNGLRSFTTLVTIKANSLTGQPRIYDFGSGSGNSLFLRANPLSAGIKLNGGTTTMVNSGTTLSTNQEYKLAVTYDAATHTTIIYVDGEKVASGTQNQNEAYMLYEVATDKRNYIGRTQWWDSSYANDNQDFIGTIKGLNVYDVALTQQEICSIQGIEYKQKELPTALQNGDFEGSYTTMSGSGVSSDRAIYAPEGWNIDYSNRNENDLSALKSGDLYFDQFFGSLAKPSTASKQTYWIRQNWGASTITLSQELRLPAGSYTLTMDLWKSGLGGDAVISVQTEGGTTVTDPSKDNKEAWQQVSLDFESDGEASTTIRLSAVHISSGSSKIIGFDNVVLTRQNTDGIEDFEKKKMRYSENEKGIYNITGRKVSSSHLKKGIYIIEGKKIIR